MLDTATGKIVTKQVLPPKQVRCRMLNHYFRLCCSFCHGRGLHAIKRPWPAEHPCFTLGQMCGRSFRCLSPLVLLPTHYPCPARFLTLLPLLSTPVGCGLQVVSASAFAPSTGPSYTFAIATQGGDLHIFTLDPFNGMVSGTKVRLRGCWSGATMHLCFVEQPLRTCHAMSGSVGLLTEGSKGFTRPTQVALMYAQLADLLTLELRLLNPCSNWLHT